MKPGILLQEEGEAMDYDRLLNLTTDLGYQLMASGAEIYRVEESMHRVLNAYGLERRRCLPSRTASSSA